MRYKTSKYQIFAPEEFYIIITIERTFGFVRRNVDKTIKCCEIRINLSDQCEFSNNFG